MEILAGMMNILGRTEFMNSFALYNHHISVKQHSSIIEDRQSRFIKCILVTSDKHTFCLTAAIPLDQYTWH